MNFLAQKRSKILLKEQEKATSGNSPFDDFYYKELAKLTTSGSWSLNFQEQSLYFDTEARRILGLSPDYKLSARAALEIFAEEHKKKAAQLYYNCGEGIPFSTTVKMYTATKQAFWAKIVGNPVYNEGNIIGIQGVFQNVNSEKTKELDLLKNIKIVETQTTTLQNFTNIVSHGLRSHASNLHLSLELLKTANNPVDRDELIENLYAISENISTTVGHISEFATIRSKAQESRERLDFNESFEKVKNLLSHTLTDVQAEIYSDFTEVPDIEYIPSYLESIFVGLMTNAVKFRDPDKNLIIEVYSYRENDITCLMIRDNGLGIDLEKHGNKIFNIYQTFHAVKDSVGVGLFLLKNKIEKMQGTISMQSKVGEGTTFTIRF